jgi:hypothetical protein
MYVWKKAKRWNKSIIHARKMEFMYLIELDRRGYRVKGEAKCV